MPDYPPLLPTGFHPMTAAQIRDLCVAGFKLSTTRGRIMDGLDQVIANLSSAGVRGSLWIDGSFLTQKIDPSDADILLHVAANFYNSATALARAAMDWLESDLKTALRIDSYLWVEHPSTGPGDWDALWGQSYWIRQFGFSRDDDPKGMALVMIPAVSP